MNWRYRRAAEYRFEARRIGEQVQWYRSLPQTERMKGFIATSSARVRKYRQMANELEAQVCPPQ